MKILEIDERSDKNMMPPSYRVSVSMNDDGVVTITRKYFNYGFYERTSEFDNFWFSDEHSSWEGVNNLYKSSFVTRNLNPEYLKMKEKELISALYDKLIENENNLKIECDKKVIIYNNRIEKCKIFQNCEIFIKAKRIKKLKNLSEIN